jgi:hypothetical protein
MMLSGEKQFGRHAKCRVHSTHLVLEAYRGPTPNEPRVKNRLWMARKEQTAPPNEHPDPSFYSQAHSDARCA